MQRLEQQLAFLGELEAMKSLLRQNRLVDGSRQEDDAQHSWHMALTALILAEYAARPVDVGKVMRMALIHDVVEIDAGDAYAYDAAARAVQPEKEQRAAKRLFGLLPPDQAAQYLALWQEFEAGETAEAQFAHACDRIQASINNPLEGGSSWKDHGVRREQVMGRLSIIQTYAPALWETISGYIDQGVQEGKIQP